MNFKELLSVADYNKNEAQYEASFKRYSTDLPPPKKEPKSNTMSKNIKKFLERKKAEEEAKVAEERKRKEKLLALRAQNSKNSKKAKIMASRTKDNDFSRIKLTEDEIEAKKKREAELLRKNLNDKVERMKARIEMEEKEKLLPKKRKRKSKNGEVIENHEDVVVEQQHTENTSINLKSSDKNTTEKTVRKPKAPPPPALSFNELLKIAEKKQFEPLEIVVKKKEEERPLSRKERRLLEMEQDRLRRKEEEKYQRSNVKVAKSSNSLQTTVANKKNSSEKSNKPLVIHVEKASTKQTQESSQKFKIPKGVTMNGHANKTSLAKEIDVKSNSNKTDKSAANIMGKPVKYRENSDQKKIISKTEINSFKDVEVRKKILPKKNGMKINPASASLCKQPPPAPAPKIDEDALTAAIEKRIREKIEKEMEEKFAKYSLQLQNKNSQPETPNIVKTVTEKPKQVTKKVPVPVNNNKNVNRPILNSKEDINKMLVMKKQMEQRKPIPKLPEKKVFHKNPYLEPPRRLLEPQRPMKPFSKRRIESDDDDDEDDMSDFIDDGPSQNEEDYSKYIKEIFGYDKSRYADDDEDEVMESSYAEQMKEEVRSAKLGYLEDLEEERLQEMERKRKKKLKK